MRKLFWCFLALCVPVIGADAKGIRPLSDRSNYSVTCFTEAIGIAANLLKTDQIHKLFGPAVARDYVVVEVGFYSKNRTAYEVRQSDFALRLRPSRVIVKAAQPGSMVENWHKPEVAGAPAKSHEAALLDKTLPEVATSQAIAGYLYFLKTADSNGAASYELDYTGNGVWLTLPLKQ